MVNILITDIVGNALPMLAVVWGGGGGGGGGLFSWCKIDIDGDSGPFNNS